MQEYVIHPLVVGANETDQGVMTYLKGYGKRIWIPIYVFYLEGGPEKILVDTGLEQFMVPPEVEEQYGLKIQEFEAALDTFGLKPEDIDIIIHTHLHNDHCENDYKCANATFYIHEKELEHVHSPHPLDFRYMEDYILDIEANGQIRTVVGDQEIVPGIRVIHTPVHTEGGLTVLIDTAKGTAVITGFCLIMENFFPPKKITAMEMEVIPPGTHINANKSYDIVLKVKNMADILLPLHEPQFAALNTIP